MDHEAILRKILAFRKERDWEQFHNPKDLAAGLSIEASELLELFLWKNGPEVDAVIAGKREQIEDELADVAWFLMLLSHDLGIDLEKAIERKIEKNAAKYPSSKARGRSDKYDAL